MGCRGDSPSAGIPSAMYVPVQHVVLRAMGVSEDDPSFSPLSQEFLLLHHFVIRYRPKRTYGDFVFPLDDGRQEVFDAGTALYRRALGDRDGNNGYDNNGDRNFTMDVSMRDAWTLEFTLCERGKYQ